MTYGYDADDTEVRHKHQPLSYDYIKRMTKRPINTYPDITFMSKEVPLPDAHVIVIL